MKLGFYLLLQFFSTSMRMTNAALDRFFIIIIILIF